MFSKVKDFVMLQLVHFNSASFRKGSMHVIVFICLTYAITVILYIAGWVYQWIIQDKLQFEQLLALLKEFSSPAAVAFFGFLAAALIDKNKDGIPDKFQNKEENTP